MSNFKVLQAVSLSNEQREIIIPRVPQIALPSQITLLNYPIQNLKDQLQAFFEEPPIDKLSLVKTLRIIGCSLNDNKLIAAVEKIISTQMNNNNGNESGKKVYELLALWAGYRFNLADFVGRMSAATRKTIILLIFEEFLMGNHCRQLGIQHQLGALLGLTSSNDLLTQLKKRYLSNNSPLKSSIRKCMQVHTEHQTLRQLIASFASYCITIKADRLMQFTIGDDRQELEYLIQNVPSLSATFIGQLKQTITQDNISKLASSNSKINTVLQAAIKEWVNDKNNYWKVVERGFDGQFREEVKEVISYGKMLIKQQLQSECITVKLLYWYLQGKYFDFGRGDALVANMEKENWMQTYKSIGQTSSYRMVNLTVLNKTLVPSWWKQSDPRKKAITNKPLKKFMEKHSDFLQEKEKEFAEGNKKIELVFNVVIVLDKETAKQHFLTFEQLQKWINGQPPSKVNYKDEYSPFREEVKAKQQVRKEHNVIIQAKLVRLLKRAKQNLSVEGLAKESGYSVETVELAVKRLVSKNLAEEDGKGGYKYSA